MEPTKLNFLKLNTDAAVKLNPPTASGDGVVRDHCGVWVTSFHTKISPVTATEAEIWAQRVRLALAFIYSFGSY